MEVSTTEKKLIEIIRSCKTKSHIDGARKCVINAMKREYITGVGCDRVQVALNNKNFKIMGECYEF